ncbi:N-acetylmuramidase family protein [Candidatus Woesearchaeota archaeon]|nr:N-acetylmuramidase family protein [Candidatus Woesearchaeota archaeon]
MGFVSGKRGRVSLRANRSAQIHSIYFFMFEILAVFLMALALFQYVNNVATDLGFEKRYTAIDLGLLTTTVLYAPGTLKQVYVPVEFNTSIDIGFSKNILSVKERGKSLQTLFWFLSDTGMEPFESDMNLEYTKPNITFYKTGRMADFDKSKVHALQMVCPVLNTTDNNWKSKKVFIAKVLPKKEDYSDLKNPANRIAQILTAQYSTFSTGSAATVTSAESQISAIPSDAELVIILGDSGQKRESGSLVAYIPVDDNLMKERKLACFLLNDLLTPETSVYYAQVMPVYLDSINKTDPLRVFNERSSAKQAIVFIDISGFSESQVFVDVVAKAIYRAVERYYGGYGITSISGATFTFSAAQAAASAAASQSVSLPSSSGTKLSSAEKDSLLKALSAKYGYDLPVLKSIITVETRGSGFGSDGKMIIRFEPHVFNRECKCESGGWGSSTRVDRKVGGVSCEGGQSAEYACLEKAVSINEDAAYRSISMGLPQIMGFHAKRMGYSDAKSMFADMSKSETVQLEHFIMFLSTDSKLSAAVKQKDWNTIARIYNGDSTGRYSSALQKYYVPSEATTAVA